MEEHLSLGVLNFDHRHSHAAWFPVACFYKRPRFPHCPLANHTPTGGRPWGMGDHIWTDQKPSIITTCWVAVCSKGYLTNQTREDKGSNMFESTILDVEIFRNHQYPKPCNIFSKAPGDFSWELGWWFWDVSCLVVVSCFVNIQHSLLYSANLL